jgi:hypothetical protein
MTANVKAEEQRETGRKRKDRLAGEKIDCARFQVKVKIQKKKKKKKKLTMSCCINSNCWGWR